MGKHHLMWSDLTLDPPSRSNEDSKMLITRLLLVLEVCKMHITRLLLVLEVCNMKSTYGKSWAGNHLVWSDLTLGPSFKVKQG